jgi:hypothetical protein
MIVASGCLTEPEVLNDLRYALCVWKLQKLDQALSLPTSLSAARSEDVKTNYIRRPVGIVGNVLCRLNSSFIPDFLIRFSS